MIGNRDACTGVGLSLRVFLKDWTNGDRCMEVTRWIKGVIGGGICIGQCVNTDRNNKCRSIEWKEKKKNGR